MHPREPRKGVGRADREGCQAKVPFQPHNQGISAHHGSLRQSPREVRGEKRDGECPLPPRSRCTGVQDHTQIRVAGCWGSGQEADLLQWPSGSEGPARGFAGAGWEGSGQGQAQRVSGAVSAMEGPGLKKLPESPVD